MKTANTKAVRTRQLISSLKRRITATRLSRLPLVTKLLGEGALATTACPHNSFSSPITVPAAVSVKLPTIARPTEARLAQASLAKEIGDAVAEDERAGGLKGRALTAVFDREAVLAMNSQQRFAYLRARITALSAQLTESELSLTTISESERDGFLNHLAEELRGIGDVFVRDSYGDIFGDIDSAAPRSSLQISERISEAATVVDGQIFAPDNLLREILHRAWRMSSGSAPPPPQDTHISLEEDRLRISSDSTITAGAQHPASNTDGTQNRRSRQSVGPSTLSQNELLAHQPHPAMPDNGPLGSPRIDDSSTFPSPPTHDECRLS